MKTLAARFRVATSMFLSGADQDQAELRLSSLKGALRFWWRALAWTRHNGDLSAIRQEESSLFGSSDTGQASVLMRLSQPADIDDCLGEQRASDWRGWRGYVGYGLVDKSARPRRAYIQPGCEFGLTLSARDDASLTAVRDALIAFGLLGNMGGRSRKGWGSVNLLELTDDRNGQLAWQAPSTVDELRARIDPLLTSDDDRWPDYTAVSAHTRVAIGPPESNPDEAHRYLAELYREAVRSTPGKAQREQYGLPRGERKADRRASPLLLHIHQLPNGQGVPVATFLPARFLENQETPDGEWQQIHRFLDGVVSGELP